MSTAHLSAQRAKGYLNQLQSADQDKRTLATIRIIEELIRAIEALDLEVKALKEKK